MGSKILIIIALISSLSSAEKKIKKETAVDTKLTMSTLLEQIIGLKKFLVSEDEFKDPKNHQTIENHLHLLSGAVKKTKHDPKLIRENFKFSRHVLEEHVTETERVFRVGNKSYARWMANSTLNICMSCHTQGSTNNRHFNEFLNPKVFTSDFDRAEFLFTVKDFENANPIYQNLIQNYTDTSLAGEKLETSVRRQVAYYSRIKRNFVEGQAVLSKFLENKQLPEFMKMNLNAWIDVFKKWEKISLPDPSKAKAEQLLEFAEKNLSFSGPQSMLAASDPRLVSNLVVSGILFEYLSLKSHSPKTPDILYWLAKCDREVNSTFFYSLSDLYLRECIVQYPETPIAQKCYKEYEANTILGYTGSIGTNLPSDVTADLRRLKNMVDGAAKLKSKKTSP